MASSISSPEINKMLEMFIAQIKRGQIRGSLNISKRTSELLRDLISHSKKGCTARELMQQIKEAAKVICEAQPLDFVIGNTCRRVLYFVREEYMNALKEASTEDGASRRTYEAMPSLISFLDSSSSIDFSLPLDVKASVLDAVRELMDEMSSIQKHIADQAIQHIHANEVVLTYCHSSTVERFLKAAAKKRQFEVIVAESAPNFSGQQLAVSLSKEGVATTLITDAEVFAVMPRVSKVILSPHAVMANGGLIAPVGSHMVALAAHEHSVPVVVCTGMYKLTPLFPVDQDSFNERYAPSQIIKFEDAGTMVDDVHVHNPAFDYIPPELINLFVTNLGSHNPSYIYRLLAEYYNPEDYSL